MAKPVLTLTTRKEQSSVLVDGKAYRLVSPEALSIPAYHKFSKLAQRLQGLWNTDTMSEAQCTELEDVLDQLCRLILEVPAAVHAKLNDLQRMQCYQAFLGLPQAALLQVAASGAAAETSAEAPLSTPKRRPTH